MNYARGRMGMINVVNLLFKDMVTSLTTLQFKTCFIVCIIFSFFILRYYKSCDIAVRGTYN